MHARRFRIKKIGSPSTRFRVAGLMSAALALAPAVSAAQGVSLATGFTDFTSWTLFGSATAANTTPGNGFLRSAI